MELTNAIKELATVDIFSEGNKKEDFIGRPFYLDYEKASLLVADAWKIKVGGVAQGTFLLAFYENEEKISEALLLRAIRPTKLPTDNDVICSMIEYYKDNLKTAGKESQLDDFTRYEFSFSGLDCRILGTFYKDQSGKIVFGADVENFYSSHNYSVYKTKGKVLEFIVNLRDGEDIVGSNKDVKIGHVRYSSSKRSQDALGDISVYLSPKDFLGKRTALFGMTRTGKSNTVKKVIQATVEISNKSRSDLGKNNDSLENSALTFDKNGIPKFPVGQIIFDINGEYANANLQDEGTAIFELFKKDTVRYSVLEKKDFRVMKVNFYKELEAGFNLISNHFKTIKENSDYVGSFLATSLEKPDDYESDFSNKTRYDRKVAAYLCCLYRAGFPVPQKFKVTFKGAKEINEAVRQENLIDPSKGISLEDATIWFTWVWENYKTFPFFKAHKDKGGNEWADEELRAILAFLTRHKEPGATAIVSGYLKLKPLIKLHSDQTDISFEISILEDIRKGKIIIVDLSQGDTEVQKLYSERICERIFADANNRFIKNSSNNFIQFYFEEAHNLFPKKEDNDLSQIYNKLAKEGAKLNLGLIYATQEVSSISANILKNTQNWFVAHLNNEDELKEIRKYYDFGDFAESLIRFSASSDKGFVRMKTYSNPFVVPVQIDRFTVKID